MDLKNKLEITYENANIDDIYENYIKDIISIIEKQAPTSRRHLTNRKHKTWYDKNALKLKIQRRKGENTWHKSQLDSDKRHYLHIYKCYKRHLYHSKKETLRDQLSTDKNKSKTLYKITKTLTIDTKKASCHLLL